jgi:hypothetical protein
MSMQFKLCLCIRSILELHVYAIYNMLLFSLFCNVQRCFLLKGVRHCSECICMKSFALDVKKEKKYFQYWDMSESVFFQKRYSSAMSVNYVYNLFLWALDFPKILEYFEKTSIVIIQASRTVNAYSGTELYIYVNIVTRNTSIIY